MGDNETEYKDMVDNLSPCCGPGHSHLRYNVDVGIVFEDDNDYWITMDEDGNILAHTYMVNWPADELAASNALRTDGLEPTGCISCYDELLGDAKDLDGFLEEDE